MKNQNLLLIVSTLILSANANSAIISTDWHTAGDNLITRDTASGLDWIDLTETNGQSYNFVSGELGIGGLYEGYRYATDDEVISLWSNFNINLSYDGVHNDPNILEHIDIASFYLGDVLKEWTDSYAARPYSSGVMGLTSTFYSKTDT